MEILYTSYLSELDMVPAVIIMLLAIICTFCFYVGLFSVIVMKKTSEKIIGIFLLIITLSITTFFIIKSNKNTNYVDYREITIGEEYEFNSNFLDQWSVSKSRGKIFTIEPRKYKSIKDEVIDE